MSASDSSGLKKQAIRGARWGSIATGAASLLRLVQVIVLARFLEPEEFGLVGMTFIVVELGRQFGNMGLSQALIQRQNISPSERSSVYWLNLMCGCALFAIAVASTPLAARVFGAPELHDLIPVASLSIVLAATSAQFQALARKALRFKFLGIVDIAGAVVLLLTSTIGVAVFDLGVWALVWAQLASRALRAVWLAVDAQRRNLLPRLHFSLKESASFARFGVFLVGQSLVQTLRKRGDQALIGALLGAQALGYYRVACSVCLEPLRKVNN
ncbi:MAG: oligosaccharide flippase family protein, partial [Gammaproteobacteria bacterium]